LLLEEPQPLWGKMVVEYLKIICAEISDEVSFLIGHGEGKVYFVDALGKGNSSDVGSPGARTDHWGEWSIVKLSEHCMTIEKEKKCDDENGGDVAEHARPSKLAV
jgi:hypothetical protein